MVENFRSASLPGKLAFLVMWAFFLHIFYYLSKDFVPGITNYVFTLTTNDVKEVIYGVFKACIFIFPAFLLASNSKLAIFLQDRVFTNKNLIRLATGALCVALLGIAVAPLGTLKVLGYAIVWLFINFMLAFYYMESSDSTSRPLTQQTS